MLPTTFGDSSSAVTLVEILEKNPTFQLKVSALLQEFNTVNRELKKSNLPIHLKKSFINSNLERFKMKADNIDVKEIKTFTQNILKQNYRKILKSI